MKHTTRRSSRFGIILASALAIGTLCAPPANADEDSTDKFGHFSHVPGAVGGTTVTWKSSIDVWVLLPEPEPQDPELTHLSDMVLKQTHTITEELASAAGILSRDATIDPAPISVNLVAILQPMPRNTVTPFASTSAYVRRGPDGKELCTLIATWHSDAMIHALIEISVTASPGQATGCLKEQNRGQSKIMEVRRFPC